MNVQLIRKSARLLIILYACFISIFALDVFESDDPWYEILIGLLIHLIPTFLLLFITWLARKRDLLPAACYTTLAIAFIVWAWGRFPLLNYVIIAGPLLLAALLHTTAWIKDMKRT